MMREDEAIKFGSPLTELEIEHLRCLIGNHYFKDVGNDDGKGCCVICGVKDGEE